METAIQTKSELWTREQMLESLEEFSVLYERRPIQDNQGGMKSPHMFLAWFVLKTLKPKAIVESGVWYGQGTWLFEQACPDAELHCIDTNLKRIQYKSRRAKYYDRDFSTIDWSHLPKEDTVLFFDDHQNAYERVKTAKWIGFSHLLFEDNYPLSQGDCYSLKKVFMSLDRPITPVEPKRPVIQKVIESLFKVSIQRKESQWQPNSVDAQYLKDNIEVYCELPPVFKASHTRWGGAWDEQNYPTPQPLLQTADKQFQKIFLDEAIYYTWMCYVKLK